MGGGYPFWHSDLHLGPMSNQKGALVGIGGATVVGNRAGPLIALLRQMRVTRYMRYIYAICVKKICYS